MVGKFQDTGVLPSAVSAASTATSGLAEAYSPVKVSNGTTKPMSWDMLLRPSSEVMTHSRKAMVASMSS